MDLSPHDVVKNARPRFKEVSPLAALITLIFGYGNILLGLGLASYKVQLAHLLTVNQVLTYPLWGAIFIFLGFCQLGFYYKNSWILMRRSMMAGIIIKSFWLIGLLARYLTGDAQNTIVPTVWLIILSIQTATYIYFLPTPRKVDNLDGKVT